jgi:hypothetical protein
MQTESASREKAGDSRADILVPVQTNNCATLFSSAAKPFRRLLQNCAFSVLLLMCAAPQSIYEIILFHFTILLHTCQGALTGKTYKTHVFSPLDFGIAFRYDKSTEYFDDNNKEEQRLCAAHQLYENQRFLL